MRVSFVVKLALSETEVTALLQYSQEHNSDVPNGSKVDVVCNALVALLHDGLADAENRYIGKLPPCQCSICRERNGGK